MEMTRVFEKEELLNMQSYYERNDCSRRTAIELTTALLAEMDKPKVWEGAPEKAERAFVIFSDKSGINKLGEITYTRTLPKSRIDEIAEEAASHWEGGREALEKAIKSAILQARKERKEER